jgi:hypothetical protein
MSATKVLFGRVPGQVGAEQAERLFLTSSTLSFYRKKSSSSPIRDRQSTSPQRVFGAALTSVVGREAAGATPNTP